MKMPRAGFTLIELMIVVAILGILAAIAIPAFVTYVRRAKAAETYDVLKSLYSDAATYYMRENFTSGLSGTQHRSCTVPNSDNKVTPSPQKQAGNYSDPGFRSLGFSQGSSYFRLEIENHDASAGRCSVSPNNNDVYALRAIGNLDGDGTSSLFEFATGTTADNELYHSPALFIENETE